MEINFRDNCRNTALFFAITNNHVEVVSYMVEQGASLHVQAVDRTKPRTLPGRKRKLWCPDPKTSCPGASTRSTFAIWEWGDEESEREPVRTKSAEHVVLENAEYLGS